MTEPLTAKQVALYWGGDLRLYDVPPEFTMRRLCDSHELLRARVADLQLALDGTANLAAELRAQLAAAEERFNDAVGIGPGSNDGPWTHCRDCRRRMVWQYPVNVNAGEPGCPAWVCPNCVTRARRKADDQLKAATEDAERLAEALAAVSDCCYAQEETGGATKCSDHIAADAALAIYRARTEASKP